MAYWAPVWVACCRSIWRKVKKPKIYYVDARHDKQRRDYGKFNQGSTRDWVCSDRELAERVARCRPRSPKNRILPAACCSIHQSYRTRGVNGKRANTATFVLKATMPTNLIVSAMSKVQLAVLPATPANVSLPVGRSPHEWRLERHRI